LVTGYCFRTIREIHLSPRGRKEKTGKLPFSIFL